MGGSATIPNQANFFFLHHFLANYCGSAHFQSNPEKIRLDCRSIFIEARRIF